MDRLFAETALPVETLLARLGIACAFGAVLGLDREIRGKAAGIRTHMLVALSSAMTMIVAIELDDALRRSGRGDGDPIRAIQGLAQAIGFLCAGVIFVNRGNVHGLTTAASLWMTSTIGIAAGAGQTLVTGIGTGFAALIVTATWLTRRRRPAPADREAG